MIDGSFRMFYNISAPLVRTGARKGRKKKKKKTYSDIIIRQKCRGVAIMHDDKHSGYIRT